MAEANTAGCTIILFTRIPVPGRVKTRLHPILSPEECAVLQEALILDQAEKLATLGNPLVLSYSDEWSSIDDGEQVRDAFVERVRAVSAGAASFQAVPQRGSSLGDRMASALQDAFELGARGCLLMGSDLPDIMRTDIQVAERALTYSDVVLGPTADGGYWLIGMREPFPQIFEGKHYGTGTVLTEAVAASREMGRTVALSRETFDIDVPQDYFQLCNQVNMGDFRLGPRTVDAVRNQMGVSAANGS